MPSGKKSKKISSSIHSSTRGGVGRGRGGVGSGGSLGGVGAGRLGHRLQLSKSANSSTQPSQHLKLRSNHSGKTSHSPRGNSQRPGSSGILAQPRQELPLLSTQSTQSLYSSSHGGTIAGGVGRGGAGDVGSGSGSGSSQSGSSSGRRTY